MIVETTKGTVSLAGATSVTTRRNPLAYIPKIIGLIVAVLGLAMLLLLVGSAITERADTPWYGWLIISLFALVTLSIVIGGGLMMLGDPGPETKEGFRVEEDSYTNISFLLIMLGGASLFVVFLAPPQDNSFGALPSAIFCFVLAAVTYWSKGHAGKVDATIAYPTHRTTVKALTPYEAERLTSAMRRDNTPVI